MSSKLTKKVNNAQLKTVKSYTETFIGPIPPPTALEKYESIVPGSADRIISNAESEQSFRHNRILAFEERVLNVEIGQQGIYKRSQILSFALCIVAFLCVATALVLGYSTAAGIIASTTVVGLLTAYLKTPFNSKRNDVTKSEKLDDKH